MTVRKHATKLFRSLSLPVSYRVLDQEGLTDARNVFDNKGVTETRYGLKRYNNTSLGGAILSVSTFKHSNGTVYKLAKVGTVLYSVTASGAATAIRTGLSATTKHRAVTLNDRHIIAIESDGLFSYNGTIFTELGQLPPTTGSVAIGAGGSLSTSDYYQVGITFYSSTTGLETNIYEISTNIKPTAGNQTLNISSIPTSASNPHMDTVRIYLKNNGNSATGSGNSFLFSGEMGIGPSTFSITSPTYSTITPPTKNAPPPSGGAKYIALFGKRIVIAGNSTYPNEVFVSEDYLPDAFDGNAATQTIIFSPGQGPITGLAVGLYNDATLAPFLVIFKKSSTSVYSEVGDIPNLNTLDAHVGCISHDTIRVRNGDVVFMGSDGWNVIVNGNIVKDDKGAPARLGNGAIDDIFSRKGWSNELNIPQASSFFSAYSSPDAQYITFVCEGANTEIRKAYVYEERINGFRVWEFTSQLTCAVEGEDDDGYSCLFIGDSTGSLLTYSSRNPRHDEDYAGTSQKISAYVILPFIVPGDDSCTYNFRTLAVRAIASSNPVTVDVFPTFSLLTSDSFVYDFTNSSDGFVLDSSTLDVDVLRDERTPVTYMADINRTGEVLLIKFSQDILDANISILSAQLTLNKNGNRNA